LWTKTFFETFGFLWLYNIPHVMVVVILRRGEKWKMISGVDHHCCHLTHENPYPYQAEVSSKNHRWYEIRHELGKLQNENI